MAYTTDDLFGGDSLMGDPNDLDNLLGFGGNGNLSDNDGQGREEVEDGEDKDDESGEKKDGDKKPEEKKVVRVKRPQPKLDAERLKGPRGLIQLKKSLADIKFQGKGHEPEDLQRVMARLEHWSHRLFPKLQFDDFIEKLEKLGSKKVVQNYIKRLRMGLEDEDTDRVKSDNEEAVDDPDPIADDSMGEFDRLLAEQVSLHDSMAAQTPRAAPANQVRTPASVFPQRPTVSSTPSTLTPEQRARIEANRLAAMERRKTRAAQREAEAQDAAPVLSPAHSPAPARSHSASPAALPESSGDADRDAGAAAEPKSGEKARAPTAGPVDLAKGKTDGDDTSEPSAGKKDTAGKAKKDLKLASSELCLSEASSSSSEVNIAEKKPPEPTSDKKCKSSSKKSDGSSSDEDTDHPKSSSGGSSPSESSGKRSSDNDQPSKKSKVDADRPVPSPEETSWGLRAFMEKSDSNPNEVEEEEGSKDNNNENDNNANITRP